MWWPVQTEMSLMTQTMAYRVAVDDREVVIRADRSLFDAVALTELIDYLQQETNRRRADNSADVDSVQRQLQQEVEAYKTMHVHLLQHYRGEWVAVHHGQLLDHDPDEDILMQRLAVHHSQLLPLIRQVEDEADRELSMPSLRLVA